MVYLKLSTGAWPTGAVCLTGMEGNAFRTRERLVPEPVYLVLGRYPNPDLETVRSMSTAFFRGSDVSSFTPCELGELQPNGRDLSVSPLGALVVLRDGSRYLLDTATDDMEVQGRLFGKTRDTVLGDTD